MDKWRSRHSIRKYSDRPIEKNKQQQLKEILLRSPSSKNKKPWRFYFVNDREKLQKLSVAKRHASYIADAALAVVIAAEKGRSDVWVEDCSIAGAYLHIAAHQLGLASCWTQIRRRFHNDETAADDYVRQVLSIETEDEILAIIAIGYPAESKAEIPAENLSWDKIIDI